MTTATDLNPSAADEGSASASLAVSPTPPAALPADGGGSAGQPTDGPVADAAPVEPVSAELAPAEAGAAEPTSAEPSAAEALAEPTAAAPRAADASHSPQPPRPTAPAAPVADCGPLLKKSFPALFAGGAKPLKLRIQVDIQERAPGVFSKQALSAFFRRYTGSTSYLIAVSRAKNRFDLDGAPAGELSEEHRKIALDELARRRGNTESRAALEEQQRRNRATLLHDFERTTLTPANFCALKGIAVDELDGYLATARREAAERPQNPRAFDDDRSGPARGQPDRGGQRRPAPQRQQPASRPDGPRADGARPGPRADGARPAPRRR